MTTVSTGAEAILMMGTSVADPLPLPASDTFTKVPQLKTLDVPQCETGTTKENTLDGVTIDGEGSANWSNCTGAFVTNYTQTTHNNMIADIPLKRKRNWRSIEPDAGGRQTDFVGRVIRAKGQPYAASLEGAPARQHEFEIAVSGTPTITP